MILSHSLIGVPLTYYLIKGKTEFQNKPLFINFMYAVGITASVFPDFDLILSFFITELDHRKLVSHSIIVYLLIFLIGIFVSKVLKKYKSEIQILNLIFFLGVLSHLFLDFIVGGISLLAPFSSYLFGLPIYFNFTSDFYSKYFSSFYFLLELPLIAYSIYRIFKLKSFVVIKTLPLLFLTIALLMVFYNF